MSENEDLKRKSETEVHIHVEKPTEEIEKLKAEKEELALIAEDRRVKLEAIAMKVFEKEKQALIEAGRQKGITIDPNSIREPSDLETKRNEIFTGSSGSAPLSDRQTGKSGSDLRSHDYPTSADLIEDLRKRERKGEAEAHEILNQLTKKFVDSAKRDIKTSDIGSHELMKEGQTLKQLVNQGFAGKKRKIVGNLDSEQIEKEERGE